MSWSSSEHARSRLLVAIKSMADRKDVIQDTHGNVSCLAEPGLMYIKPSGVPYEEIRIRDLSKVSFDEAGKISWADNGFVPSVDTPHHIRIYLRNPWVKAICHTHSPHVVAHAIVSHPIECLCTEQADYFGGHIPCMPYRDLDSWSQDILLSEGTRALILGNHGGLTFSDDPVKAVDLAIQMENVARKNILAKQIDPTIWKFPMKDFDAKEIDKWHRRYVGSYGQR